MPIESGILGQTHDFAFALTEDHTFSFIRCREFKYFLHLFLGHPASCTIGTGIGYGKAAWVHPFIGFGIAKLEVQDDCRDRRNKDHHTLQPLDGEGRSETDQRAHIRRLNRNAAQHTASICPGLIVIQKLA